MREWHKPTIEETESGMEVTSYLPAGENGDPALARSPFSHPSLASPDDGATGRIPLRWR